MFNQYSYLPKVPSLPFPFSVSLSSPSLPIISFPFLSFPFLSFPYIFPLPVFTLYHCRFLIFPPFPIFRALSSPSLPIISLSFPYIFPLPVFPFHVSHFLSLISFSFLQFPKLQNIAMVSWFFGTLNKIQTCHQNCVPPPKISIEICNCKAMFFRIWDQ